MTRRARTRWLFTFFGRQCQRNLGSVERLRTDSVDATSSSILINRKVYTNWKRVRPVDDHGTRPQLECNAVTAAVCRWFICIICEQCCIRRLASKRCIKFIGRVRVSVSNRCASRVVTFQAVSRATDAINIAQFFYRFSRTRQTSYRCKLITRGILYPGILVAGFNVALREIEIEMDR